MKLELFFDYACPYCYRGHKNLLELIEKYPELEIIWRPCEAHPRPEPASVHSDLAIQGMYFIRDNQGDLWNYHRLAYEAVFEKRADISDPEFLASLAGQCGVDSAAFLKALKDSRYAAEVKDGNRYAWGENGLHAVPSYLSGSRFIGSRDGILVSKQELDRFLSELL